MVKKAIATILLTTLLLAGCSDVTPEDSRAVFGNCRFCNQPGYSSVLWMDSVEAQAKADAGDKEVLGTIVCGECRKNMELKD